MSGTVVETNFALILTNLEVFIGVGVFKKLDFHDKRLSVKLTIVLLNAIS